MIVLAGCTNQVANDVDAPINAIKDTDTVVETNIQSAITSASTVAATHGLFTSFSPSSAGMAATTGPSTGPGDLSYAVAPGGGALVLAAWNHTDQHCIGAVVVSQQLTTPILGVLSPNSQAYDFIAPAATSSACSASAFAATPASPTGWQLAPTTSGYPLP